MVATATAPSQNPPSSVEVYEFSYNRYIGKMRFRLDGQEWHVGNIVCKRGAQSMGVDSQGKWQLRIKLILSDKTYFVEERRSQTEVRQVKVWDYAYVYLPPDVDVAAAIDDVLECTIDSHVRLCYNRADSERTNSPHFRLRDERTQKLYSNDVVDYKGIININWMDGGPHVFHDGQVYLDPEGIAHFAP